MVEQVDGDGEGGDDKLGAGQEAQKQELLAGCKIQSNSCGTMRLAVHKLARNMCIEVMRYIEYIIRCNHATPYCAHI